MTFSDKARCVAECWYATHKVAEWEGFWEFNDLGGPLAFAYAHDYASLKVPAKDFVEDSYEWLVKIMDIPDGEYSSWAEMVEAQSKAE